MRSMDWAWKIVLRAHNKEHSHVCFNEVDAKTVQFLNLCQKKTIDLCRAYNSAIIVEKALRNQPVPDLVLEPETDTSPQSGF